MRIFIKNKHAFILTILLIGVSFFSLTGCKKFLDTKPSDFISPEAYYNTKEQLNYSLAGVYDIMGSQPLYANRYIARMGLEADEGNYSADKNNLVVGPQVYNISSSDPDVADFWNALYDGINRANVLIKNVNKNPQIADSIRKQVYGEALFLRAYYYFILVQNFGGVPLRLEPTVDMSKLDMPRSSAKEVYEKIITDMTEAEGLVLPVRKIGYAGRVSKSAVRGILARVCLYMAGYPVNDVSKYQEARNWAKKVIDDPEAAHNLLSDFKQVFINYSQDKYDVSESIWEVEFWGNRAAPYNETGVNGGWNGIASQDILLGVSYGWIRVNGNLYSAFDKNDVRRNWSCFDSTYKADGKAVKTPSVWNYCAGKYRRTYEQVLPKAQNQTPINWPLLRFSDVLLMYSEAENEINKGPTADALLAINRVRQRAYAPLLAVGGSYQSFRDTIVKERSLELCYEGLRKPDLIRWGIFLPKMKAELDIMKAQIANLTTKHLAFENVQEKNLLFPIPFKELSLNGAIEQNPLWK